MLKRIPISEWLYESRKPLAKHEPQLFLCELPFSVKEMEDRYGLDFFEHEEDGLGDCYSDTVKINEVPYLFFGTGSRENKDICVCAKFLKSEITMPFCLDNLCAGLVIDKAELRWIRDDLND